jgi:chromosome segregation ATPase
LTHETEHGFGTGLRAQLARRHGPSEAVEAVEVTPRAPAPPAEPVGLEPEPTPDPQLEQELEAMRKQLGEALARERELRESLEHHVEAYERGLEADRDQALRLAVVEQDATKLEHAEANLSEREERLTSLTSDVAKERRELTVRRTELLTEEARLAELGVQLDARLAEAEAAETERTQAVAELAKRLAAIGDRERDLQRDRAALETAKGEVAALVASREQAAREAEESLRQRERSATGRERALDAAEADIARERARLQERAQAFASRESQLEQRFALRTAELDEQQTSLAQLERSLGAQEERLKRERAGQGHTTQEAFALLSELERRETDVRRREAELERRESELGERHTLAQSEVARGDELAELREQLERRQSRTEELESRLTARLSALQQAEHELRLRDARAEAELDLREQRLLDLLSEIEVRERRADERERDLVGYVGEVQQRLAS